MGRELWSLVLMAVLVLSAMSGCISASRRECPESHFWCESGEECVPSWEECQPAGPGQAREWAIKAAEEHARLMTVYREKNGRGLAVTGVTRRECPGCWAIGVRFYIDSDSSGTGMMDVDIALEEFEVADVTSSASNIPVISPQECMDLGGRPLSVAGGMACGKDEYTAGEMGDRPSFRVCCVPRDMV